MSIEDQIQALLSEAAPLRLLPDDEAEERGLPRLVARVNALRNKQANGLDDDFIKEVARGIEDAYGRKAKPGEAEYFAGVATVEGADAEPVKRGPGRPKKAD